MRRFFCPLLGLAAALASCQPQPGSSAAATPAIPDEAAAHRAVSRFIRAQPNAGLYVPDSARVVDAGAHWQVLVPRTDWAGRMPNRARFEVDKQTGQVGSQPVK